VIPVYEAGEWEGQLFLAMRCVDGTDLEAIIACEEKLHPRQAAPIIAQVASALHAAHERGLVHRDVKPGNVLIENRDGSPHAYVTDFGLSKLTSSTTGLTRTGRWVGTVDYAAPEQVQAGEADARTDVYALGCVLYEALTGQRAAAPDRGRRSWLPRRAGAQRDRQACNGEGSGGSLPVCRRPGPSRDGGR
jgi:serine/threonine protein kinase